MARVRVLQDRDEWGVRRRDTQNAKLGQEVRSAGSALRGRGSTGRAAAMCGRCSVTKCTRTHTDSSPSTSHPFPRTLTPQPGSSSPIRLDPSTPTSPPSTLTSVDCEVAQAERDERQPDGGDQVRAAVAREQILSRHARALVLVPERLKQTRLQPELARDRIRVVFRRCLLLLRRRSQSAGTRCLPSSCRVPELDARADAARPAHAP